MLNHAQRAFASGFDAARYGMSEDLNEVRQER
jgi:hypothetical protein